MAKQDLFNAPSRLAQGNNVQQKQMSAGTPLAQFLLNKHQQSAGMIGPGTQGNQSASGQGSMTQTPFSNVSPMMNQFGFPSPFSSTNGNQMMTQQIQPGQPTSMPTLAEQAGPKATSQQQMEQHVRQHILNAQLQVQQLQETSEQLQVPSEREIQQQQATQQFQQSNSQQSLRKQSPEILASTPEGQIQEVPAAPATTSASAESAGSSSDVQMAQSADEVLHGEQLNPPKPRPPSPEYDDPEGKEIHEDNTHLFRVC